MTDKQQIEEIQLIMLNAVSKRYFSTKDVKLNNDTEFLKQAEAIYNANYRRVADDEIVVKKRDRVNVFAEEFEELIRKDTANEIFTKLIEVAKNNDNKLSIGLLKAWAIEYDVEVQDNV